MYVDMPGHNKYPCNVGLTEIKYGANKDITIIPINDDAQAQAGLKGLHEDNILFIVDEATTYQIASSQQYKVLCLLMEQDY